MIYKRLFVLVSILIFLRPHLDFGPPVLSVYLADLVIIGLFILSLVILKLHIHIKDFKLLHICFLLTFSLLIPITVHLLGPSTGLQPLLDYGKIVYFIMVFWFLYFLLIRIQDPEILVNRILDYTFLIIFLVSIIQLLDLPIVGGLISGMYGTEKLRSIWTGYPRVFGTFYNANWFGVYLVFYLTWLNSKFIYKEISISKYFIKGILLVILFIISGSRTGIVGAIVALFFQFLSFKQIKKVLTIVCICIVIFGATWYFANQIDSLERTLSRFTSMIDIYKEEGIKISEMNPGREQSWMQTLEKVKQNPLFGSGSIEYIPHNSYLYFLNMFGLVGSLFATIFTGLFIYYEKQNTVYTMRSKVNQKWKHGFIPGFLIMSLAAEFFFTTQVMLLTVFLYAVSHFHKKSIKIGG